MPNLRGMRILIVEDEYLIAHDVARYFERMGAIILGPVSSIEQAAKYAGHADAAILDLNLNGKLVFPFADELAGRGVPFVFFTGLEAETIPERLQHVSALRKPADWDMLFESLFPSDRSGDAAERGPRPDDIVSTLPKLRLAARLLLSDGSAADRLVERTLERAIEESGPPDGGVSMEWLSGIMEEIAETEGLDLMH
jgi:CheY-like chemotaxis protein